MELEYLRPLLKEAGTKIVLLVLDGLGGLPTKEGGKTELETADTPHMDALAAAGVCGLHEPVRAGITPGSGPAHLGLFGYDPVRYQVGRGVLSALGVDFELEANDVAARGNFCSVDERGIITDRRAGRISTEKNEELCRKIASDVSLDGARAFVQTVKEHRFLFVLRGEGLSGDVEDTDPHEPGVEPADPSPRSRDAERTAGLIREFVRQAREVLANEQPANAVLLRGFAKRPNWPTMRDAFGLRAGVIAGYPMYRGVARLVGMTVVGESDDLDRQAALLEERWDEFDFFFVHVKKTDSYGEDGNFDAKVRRICEVDQVLPRIRGLGPDVLIVTGDHSTPTRMKSHSFHPVPVILSSPLCRPDTVTTFGERACIAGGLGPRLPAMDIMPLALGHADRLDKFGA